MLIFPGCCGPGEVPRPLPALPHCRPKVGATRVASGAAALRDSWSQAFQSPTLLLGPPQRGPFFLGPCERRHRWARLRRASYALTGERVIHGSRSSVHLELGPASSRRPLFFDGPAAEEDSSRYGRNFLTPVNHIEGSP